MQRNNVRAIGIPEKTEGKNPVQSIEQWLLQIYGKDAFSPMFSIERAHGVPIRPLLPGNPSCPILFKLLNYKDRDVILSKARSLGDALVMTNSKIPLFPDFSAEVQKQRAHFTNVKKHLRAFNVQYSMLYPARMRVVARDQVHFFEKPQLVSQWLDRAERSIWEEAANRRQAV